ncbi:hypothetical protein NDA11_007419 [Ustilago hordei]|nr:hypothetical protein NDA11_007419 [Ustilago hordei]
MSANSASAVNLKPTVKEALAGPDQSHWCEAICAELEGLKSMNISEVINMPPKAHLIDSKLVLNVKMDVNRVPYKFKAQLSAKLDWELDSIDIKQAYINARLEHNIYLKPPEGTNAPPGKVYKLLKSLYGLKQSGQEWSQVDEVKQAILNKWKIEDNGPVTEFLKIKITRDQTKWTMDLDQQAYIKEIVKEWIKPNDKTWIPMMTTPMKAANELTYDNKLRETYPALIVALCIIKYLNQTQDNVLHIGGMDVTGNAIETYMDANWALDPNADRKSTLGLIVKVFRNIVTWNSHIQKCVASSAVKAEYVAGSAAIREALFHRHLLCGLGFGDHTPTIFMDNTGVRGLAPETQVGLSRYSVTIKLCDSYCLSIGLDELVAW